MGLIFGGIKECKGMYGNFEGSNPYSPLFGLVIYIMNPAKEQPQNDTKQQTRGGWILMCVLFLW